MGLSYGGFWPSPAIARQLRLASLLLPPTAGEQFHQRIEQRENSRGVLGKLVAQHDCRADADLTLARDQSRPELLDRAR